MSAELTAAELDWLRMMFAAMARVTRTRRDDLLTDVLAARFRWSDSSGEGWRSLAWEDHEIRALAELSGFSVVTVRRRLREVHNATLTEAQARAVR